MTVKRADDITAALLLAIKDCFSSSKHFHLTRSEMSERLQQRVYLLAGYVQLPQHRKSYLSGYIDALWDSYWAHMSWYFQYEGNLVPAQTFEGDYSKVEGGCHVYTDRPDIKFNPVAPIGNEGYVGRVTG